MQRTFLIEATLLLSQIQGDLVFHVNLEKIKKRKNKYKSSLPLLFQRREFNDKR